MTMKLYHNPHSRAAVAKWPAGKLPALVDCSPVRKA